MRKKKILNLLEYYLEKDEEIVRIVKYIVHLAKIAEAKPQDVVKIIGEITSDLGIDSAKDLPDSEI